MGLCLSLLKLNVDVKVGLALHLFQRQENNLQKYDNSKKWSVFHMQTNPF